MTSGESDTFDEDYHNAFESDVAVGSGRRPHKKRRIAARNLIRLQDESDEEEDEVDNSDDPDFHSIYEQAQPDAPAAEAAPSTSHNAYDENSTPFVSSSRQVAIDPALAQSYADAEVIDIIGHGDGSDAESEDETGHSAEASPELGTTPQTAVEILDDEVLPQERREYRRARDYKCPICFEPPEIALFTPCGHIFCIDCLFQMINSTKANRRSGQCALCRRDVGLGKVKLLKLRKKRIPKDA
ncbi:LAME_0F11606g1_1 [Lachancea meyersii CBS 8951]|uniref:LAME_0F11606g1_1 n=1 Tax=Lachancea meyersii CBS 8951 TaxID=1266667 RepID=A0A1G4JWB8_9SACH|nr:LAME_0F11606g1_1 [Lachancea meyersii CBS 8951]